MLDVVGGWFVKRNMENHHNRVHIFGRWLPMNPSWYPTKKRNRLLIVLHQRENRSSEETNSRKRTRWVLHSILNVESICLQLGSLQMFTYVYRVNLGTCIQCLGVCTEKVSRNSAWLHVTSSLPRSPNNKIRCFSIIKLSSSAKSHARWWTGGISYA